MEKEKMLQAFMDIDNASEIAIATLNAVTADNCFDNDRLEWVVIGVIDQIKTIQRAAGVIDEVMSAKEDCAA